MLEIYISRLPFTPHLESEMETLLNAAEAG